MKRTSIKRIICRILRARFARENREALIAEYRRIFAADLNRR